MPSAEEWLKVIAHIEVASEDVDPWFLALCLDCTPLLAMPFRESPARRAWRNEHATGTGHRVLAIDVGPPQS